MICEKVDECMKRFLHISEQGDISCLGGYDCIKSFDQRAQAVCAEKEKEYRLRNDLNPNKAYIAVFNVDGGMIVNTDEKKCDYMMVVSDLNKAIVVLIELKGKDYKRAIQQINEMLGILNAPFKIFNKVYGRVIFRSKRTPNMKNIPQRMEVERKFKQLHGDFKMEKDILEESVKSLLA